MTKFIDNVTTITADWLNVVDSNLKSTADVRQFGALAGVGGNQAPAFAQALSYAAQQARGFISVPVGQWRLTDELTITGATGIRGEAKASAIMVLESAGNYGINVLGAGLGGSSTDGVDIGGINLWGSKGISLLHVHGTGLFNLHNLVAQNNTVGNIVRFTASQDGCLDNFDFLQCGGVGQATSDGAVVYYGPGCNNIYTRCGRFEAPRNTAIYVDNADTIRYMGGKIDGSYGGADLTVNPFVVCDSGSILFRDYTVTGFKNYPFSISGYGEINFNGSIGNGAAPAVFTASNPAYKTYVSVGGVPGVILKPKVIFRGSIEFSSKNTLNNKIGAVISLKAPDPLMKPNTGNNGRIQLSGVFDTGGGLFQCAIKEWNGSVWVTPATNDTYVGGWMVDSATGNAFAQILGQSGGLMQFRSNGLSSTGSEHFVQYDTFHGIPVDIQIDSPAYSQARWTLRLAELKTTITTTGASYSNGYTTVNLSATVADGSLVGCFLWNKTADVYYYISANTGSTLTVIHDRSAAITNGAYDIVIGNPKAGTGVVINWK